jgi:hypothetical protein
MRRRGGKSRSRNTRPSRRRILFACSLLVAIVLVAGVLVSHAGKGESPETPPAPLPETLSPKDPKVPKEKDVKPPGNVQNLRRTDLGTLDGNPVLAVGEAAP